MAKHQTSGMDRTFWALADPTRRGVLQRLMDQPGLSVSELARPFSLKLSRHDEASGRSVRCRIDHADQDRPHRGGESLDRADAGAMAWLNRYERFWT